MSLALKSTDVYESSSRSAKFYVRLVDAEFTMPKNAEIAGSEFICLNELEYPSEHDDIMIGFDTEAGMFGPVHEEP